MAVCSSCGADGITGPDCPECPKAGPDWMVAKKAKKHKGKPPTSKKRVDIMAKTNATSQTPEGEALDTGQPERPKFKGWPKHDTDAKAPQPPGVGTT